MDVTPMSVCLIVRVCISNHWISSQRSQVKCFLCPCKLTFAQNPCYNYLSKNIYLWDLVMQAKHLGWDHKQLQLVTLALWFYQHPIHYALIDYFFIYEDLSTCDCCAHVGSNIVRKSANRGIDSNRFCSIYVMKTLRQNRIEDHPFVMLEHVQ